jgi:type I restriction-modification system DNA methylase subunit
VVEAPASPPCRYSCDVSKPPSWNEIRTNAQQFATRWEGTSDENAESQSFWNEFLGIFGIDRKRVATFEARAKRESTGGRGRIDLLWPGTLVAEHKSAGKDLATAEAQAIDYLESIDTKDFPGVIVTSDFGNFRVRDLGGDNIPFTFPLADLPKEIDRFGFIAGYRQRKFGDKEEEEANVKAARLMGDLYEELARTGYEGHDASVLMTRLLLLMFADDTGMWEKGLFSEFIETRTQPDGSDLGAQLAMLFQVLDKAETARSANMDELLLRFPYVNGHLFSDRIDIPSFDKRMRDELVRCTDFDWSKISPAVFGSLFQAVKSKEARRTLGEHYTTEHNILRALAPLFLDDLWAEYENVRDNVQRLERLHDKIANIRVLDPACGCGNFLVIAYRELRRLELAILTRVSDLRKDTQMHLDVSNMVRVRLSHFYGIEVEEWPARIAETAMFLVDQQANHELAITFGNAPDRLPIMNAVNITVGNALRTDWESVLPAAECSYIVGNPPFVGMSLLSKEQQEDNRTVFAEIAGGSRTGRLDYVACWYAKATSYIRNTSARVALVSTNSITQGEQARELGPLLANNGIELDFAHRTFAWSSEAPGAAAVHVVIIGFSYGGQAKKKLLFDYPDIKGEPVERVVKAINIYLAPSDIPSIGKHTTPLVPNPKLTEGNRPQDGGGLIVSAEQYSEIAADPVALKYLRPLAGSQDTLHDVPRWCLWFDGATPSELRSSKLIMQRLDVVAEARAASPTASARDKAKTPSVFFSIRQPQSRWLWVPRVSSEHRRIIPMRFFGPEVIAHDTSLSLDGADEYLFGVMQSAMFAIWAKTVAGRLESRIRISPDLCYNSFPFPARTEKGEARVLAAAQAVLAARENHPGASLADLYDRLAMPADLVKAHDALDAAVDALFSDKKFSGDADRLEFLFARYAELTADLLTVTPEKKTRKKKA